MTKPTVQQIRQQVAQGMVDEAKNVARTAGEQIGIPAAELLPDHNQFDDTAAYQQELAQRERARMAELKTMIENEMRNARALREQKAREIAELQAQQMKTNEEKEEKKGGFLSGLGHSAKRLAGRLGNVGKGKMEKGRGGGG